MKIYIQNYDLINLNKAIISLKKYYLKKIFTIEISSNTGQYYIDEKNIYKLNYNDKCVKLINNFYEDLNVYIDYSYTEKTLTNQIPFDHIAIATEFFYFSIDISSNLYLVIQFAVTNKNNDLDNPIDLLPIDFYFEVGDNTEQTNNNINIFMKDELNVFFSLLTNI